MYKYRKKLNKYRGRFKNMCEYVILAIYEYVYVLKHKRICLDSIHM